MNNLKDALKDALKKFEKSNSQINMKLYNESLLKIIIDKKYDFCLSNSEKFYCIRHSIHQIPHCFNCCKNLLKFKNSVRGYGNYCSVKCSNSSSIKIAETKKTCFKKYGESSYSKTSEFKDQVITTCLDRYSVSNPSKVDKFKNKSKETCLLKYGKEYSFQSDNNKNKSMDTMKLRYGVNFAQQSLMIKNKSRKTFIENKEMYKHKHVNAITEFGWNSKEFFEKHFFKDYFDYDACMDYFNCSMFSVYKQLKRLNIKYIKKPSGFKINKPGFLYYLKITFNDKMYYKIGITNRSVQERFTKEELLYIEILNTDYFEIGKDAYEVEQSILKKHKDKIIDFKILKSGNTEIFEEDIRKLNE